MIEEKGGMMSLFGDIANAIEHTVDSLAATIGADVSMLETVVNDLDGNGVDILSAASRLGLSAEGLLSGIIDLMKGDPHQLLLERLTGPIKKLDSSLTQLASQWMQVANLHQNTAQAINGHMTDLFQSSYSGPAADTLLATHQDYQQHFSTLIEHAQTQHTRHTTLQGYTSGYLAQMPGKVNSLSTPMAAFGVLSFNAASAVMASPGEVISPEFIQQVEDLARNAWESGNEEVPPGPEDPIWDVIALFVAVLFLFAGLLLLINWLWDGISQFFKGQNSTPPQNALTPAQQNLHNDVASRLGYSTLEIDALIRAGYLDPDAIAAIIRGGGVFAVFADPNVAKMVNQLTTAQQLQFITIVDQYQITHPLMTSHQVYNYLRYIKMKAQLNLLSNDITGRSGDPTSQAIGNAFASEVSALDARLYQKVGNSINITTDPFTLTDGRLDGWYGNMTGIWGEWSTIKHYYQQGNLLALSTPLSPDGEVDLKINENGVEKWIEVKNTLTTNQWQKALNQAANYAQNGARDVILEFPQQGVNGTPDLSRQQLNNLNRLRAQYPGVNFEVRTGATDPGIRTSFDPPANNWGSYLP